jgi:hypothetical protein
MIAVMAEETGYPGYGLGKNEKIYYCYCIP